MAELSPAAQAVLDAFLGVPILLNDQQERIALAAALRAAADQVVPEENVDEADYDCLHAKWAAEGKQETRADLLAIAADLLERQAAPVPAGEVRELVALIRQIALAWEPDACLLGNMTAGQLARAADLLEQRQAAPVPVAVSEQPWERDGWCDAEGRCWMGRPLPDAPARWDWSSAVTADNATHCLPHDAQVLPTFIHQPVI